jgi:hypothetical protein
MSKTIGFACTVMCLFLSVRPQNDKFLKYRAVESYEIRPGILMMPRYSEDGQVCEVAVERRHFSNLDSTIPREMLTQIADELVPAGERGPVNPNLGREYLSAYSGNGVTTFADYKNVSIHIFGVASPIGFAGDIVAVIRWNNRRCR